jgi:signal transduction histidine kinase
MRLERARRAIGKHLLTARALVATQVTRGKVWPLPLRERLEQGSQGRSVRALALAVPGVAAAYYALAVIGTVLSVPPAGFAILWPATALVIGVLLLAPTRRWWLYLSAVVLAHVHMVYRLQQPDLALVVVLTQVLGNLTLAVTTAGVIRAVYPSPLRLNSFPSVLGFVLLAGFAVPAVVNALVLGGHLWSGWATDFWLAWRQWMLASVFPTITIPPLLLAARSHNLIGQRPASPRAYAELAALALGLLLVSLVVFSLEPRSPGYEVTLRLAPLPFLLWAAIRLGVGGTSLSLLLFAGAILAGALAGRGPFAIHSPNAEVVSLQIFLITASVPLLLLAALVEERRGTAEALQQSEARMRIAAASTDTGLWQYDFANKDLWATEHCRSMFGCPPGVTLTPELLLAAVLAEDRPIATAAMRAAQLPGEAPRRSEFRVLNPNGEIRWYLATGHTDFDARGRPLRLSGVFRDVTPRKTAETEAELLAERLLTLQDEERQRIALELHDSTAQHLLAMSLNLANLKTHIAAKPATQQLFGDITGSLQETTKEVRTFTYLLNPPQLESDGLRATLQRYADGFSQRTGLKTSLRISPSTDALPLPLQRSLLRIVQEALTNVHRHAAATRVSIDLRSIGKQTHLVIRDDGHGFDNGVEDGIDRANSRQPGGPIRLGVGIPGMSARMQQLGGKLDIRSSRRGTTVHAAMPVRAGVLRPQ